MIARTLSRPAGNNPTFLYQAACVAYKGGDLNEASRLLEMILEQDPQHTSALRLLSDIDQGREEIDPIWTPLLKVVPVSSEDLDGWQLFWVLSRRAGTGGRRRGPRPDGRDSRIR